MSYWGNDTYADGMKIIPPQSIIDGSAPAEVFLAYVNTVDIKKIPLRYYLPILGWLTEFAKLLPEEERNKLYGLNEREI